MISRKHLVSFSAFLLVVIGWMSALWAQQTGRPSPQVSSELRTLRGQIFQPFGGVFDRVIRFNFSSQDGRLNQILFTDSAGRFVIPNLDFYTTYIITVESDDHSYETTTQIVPLNTTNYVALFLKPKKHEAKEPPGTVSARDADVPPKARQAYDKGLEAVGRNRLGDAVKWMKRATELHPAYFSAYNELGVLQMKLKQLHAAVGSFQQAIRINHQSYLPFLNLGIVLCKQERFGEATLPLAIAVELNPGSAASHLYLGVALMGNRKYDEAEKELKEAYRIGGSGAATALLFLGNLYHEQQSYDKAVEAFEQYLKAMPKAANAVEVQAAIEKSRAAAREPRR
jgi:tetratricopeptide (TPR) repeat protein